MATITFGENTAVRVVEFALEIDGEEWIATATEWACGAISLDAYAGTDYLDEFAIWSYGGMTVEDAQEAIEYELQRR